MQLKFPGLVLLVLVLTSACGDPAGPPGIDPSNLSIAVQSGDRQFGGVTATLPDPLVVVVTDNRNREPEKGIAVTWRLRSGAGASFTPATSLTDSAGMASTRIQLGPTLGDYVIEASFDGAATPALLTMRAVNTPVIGGLQSNATAGDTISITGQNFSPSAGDNTVTFGGIRGAVVSATSTALRVVVPVCLPSRSAAPVNVSLGAISSASATLNVTGTAAAMLQLARGQAVNFLDPAALSCVRLPADATATYLLVPTNGTDVPTRMLPFQLRGLTSQGTPIVTAFGEREGSPAMTSFAASFELRLRERESRFTGSRDALAPQVNARIVPPTVGERREFNVINTDNKFTKVTGVVKAVSTHSVIYEDVNTPAGGFTTQDYEALGRLFDDPIYDTDVAVFGTPSDVDANGLIAILFTPVVNAMTPRNTNSYIAGFFYGCDLVEARECSGTNRAELFYSVVPDLQATFSIRHTKEEVFQTLQPVLAHEFQHMIHFNQRVLMGKAPAQESLWLSEGLAHMAEDTVGGVFAKRGATTSAFDFRRQNYFRAYRYMTDPSRTSLLSFVAPGTLEERGAAWLFLRYLMGRFTYDILGALTRTGQSSTANVTAQTGVAWNVLINDWAVALFTDDAPELGGIQPDRRYTFPDMNIRTLLSQQAIAGSGGFPLRPRSFSFTDFAITDTLPAATGSYFLLQGSAIAKNVNLNMAGNRSEEFPAEARPQFSIIRLR
jgi:hypothetical protein